MKRWQKRLNKMVERPDVELAGIVYAQNELRLLVLVLSVLQIRAVPFPYSTNPHLGHLVVPSWPLWACLFGLCVS